jgi:uncharacterized protein
MIPVVAPEPGQPCALPGPDAWEFFTGASAPAWRNEVTLFSADLAREWEPGGFVAQISPTPLLMIVAASDTLTLTDLELEAYNRALEPKRLVLLPGGHFEPYTTYFAQSSGAARDWFVQHLRP